MTWPNSNVQSFGDGSSLTVRAVSETWTPSSPSFALTRWHFAKKRMTRHLILVTRMTTTAEEHARTARLIEQLETTAAELRAYIAVLTAELDDTQDEPKEGPDAD
jgi:uncharacterized protein (UPF0261 family)